MGLKAKTRIIMNSTHQDLNFSGNQVLDTKKSYIYRRKKGKEKNKNKVFYLTLQPV